MTQSPHPGNEPQPTSNPRLWLILLRRTSLAFAVILLVGIAGGAWWAWRFIQNDLAPLVQKNIKQLLGRPVQLGEVQNFSFNSLQFGNSSIPATSTDPDHASVKAVDVIFDPWQLLFNRTLELNITLVQPDAYIKQAQDGRWISTQLAKQEEKAGFITTELQSIRFRNADVVLVPASKQNKAENPVVINNVGGIARFLQEDQGIRFEVSGQPAKGGRFELTGQTNPSAQQTKLALQAQELPAATLSQLVQTPVNIQAGRISGNLALQIEPNQPLPTLMGTVSLNGLAANVEAIPNSITNVDGVLRFKGQTIALESLNARYGKVPIQVAGTINAQTGYNISAQVKPIGVKTVLNTFKVNLPVAAKGKIQANAQVTGTLQQPKVKGTVSTVNSAQIAQIGFDEITTNFQLTTAGDSPEITSLRIKAIPKVGGQITGQGKIDLGQQINVAFQAQAENVPGDAIAKLYGASPPITIGNVSAIAKISGSPGNLQAVAQLKAPQATYPGAVEVALTPEGTIQIQNAVFNVAGGLVQAEGRVEDGQWRAVVDATQIQLSQFPQVPPQFQGRLGGDFVLTGTTESFQPQAIAARGQARLTVAGGAVNFENIRLNQGRWQALATISQVQLDRFSEQLQGQLGGAIRLAGTTESFELDDIQAQGQAQLAVAGGTVNLNNISLNNGRWQTLADISQVQLNRLSQQLRGQLRGDVRLAGTTASFQPSDIQAGGQLRFSQGLAALEQPVTAQFQWNGQQIRIIQASAPGLRAGGTVAVQLQGTQAPQIAGFNLNVQAQDYNLQALPFNLPGNVALAGQVDFAGQVTGTPTTPRAVGNVRLENFKVNNLAFDPVLTGNVAFNPGQGTQLQLSGQQDQIALTLGPNNRPTSFLIRQDETVARGRTQGETLLVNVQDFPISVLDSILPGATSNLGPIAGDLSGNVAVNLNNFTARGDVAIAQPRLGRIAADEFRGQFTYNQGAATLTAGELRQGDSRYLLSGNLLPGPNREFDFQISFDDAQIQNILQALNVYDIQDVQGGLKPPVFAGAQALTPIASVGLPNAPLIKQLRRFSGIETLLAQQRRQNEASPVPGLPGLADLEGTISGRIAVTGSLQAGINANFNIVGQDWQWGGYTIDEAIAQGTFEDGVLTVLPLRIDLGDSLVAFTGQVGSEELDGQLQVESLPVAMLKPFLPELPVETTGDLNAIVTLAGSLANPRARGELALADGTLNGQPIQTAQASFSYTDARLNFDSNVLLTGTEPIQVAGSLPIGLPFASVQPDSNQISLVADVQNEGLALLNLLTDQVAWVNGQGEINLTVQGTLNQPIVTGTATVENATLKARSLPDPLTNVTGRAVFNRDRILVEGIQGQYNQGQVIAEGVLPIFATQDAAQVAAANPLTVSLNDLALNLKGLYRGGVAGNIVVTGTALDPAIGGEIRLMDGQVAIGESTGGLSTVAEEEVSDETAVNASVNAGIGGAASSDSSLEFNGLLLVLGDDVRITRQPLLSFEASGDIRLNGTLANLRPQGVIRLTDGQVNLFTTQFTLARGYEQTAVFTPSGGLNPILDIRLVTTVTEATGSRIATSPFSAEIADVPTTYFGSVDTVRVEAKVTGPASELAENLELSSEPTRSDSEIIALLGGGFVNTLGQGGSTLGLVNFAGSALFNNFQAPVAALGEAIGLSELRLSPTIVTDPTTDSSVLGLAAEAVVDVTNDFSVSVSGIPTADQPFRYNLLYRVNDEVLLRGSTNLSGESRALVEYEVRF